MNVLLLQVFTEAGWSGKALEEQWWFIAQLDYIRRTFNCLCFCLFNV